MFNNFYKNKRVLVTGHSGFKGSWLCYWLTELGADVAGLSAYVPTDPSHFEAIGLKNLVQDFSLDIREYGSVEKVFKAFEPEVVFHLAAQPIVRTAYESPKDTFDTNAGGTVNICEALRHSPKTIAAVLITSDKCYDNVEWDWGYRENDRLGGDDPYSASKACAENVIRAYIRSYFSTGGTVNVASTRAGNVIGGGDWAKDRIVPDCMKAWGKGEKVMIRNPLATRPWQHVLDPLSGYLWLGVKLYEGQEDVCGEAFNFGPQSEVIQPVEELVEAIKRYWPNVRWEHQSEEKPHKESGLLKLTCDKALRRLKWQALLNFDQTVQFTAEWYRAFYDGQREMEEVTQKQIQAYSEIALAKNAIWSL
ncbi:MAG: CDP-glucose 4,6-dehydratase [Candidatus Omnitrophica bacterium]|nr:CDP-glucose 4,6-dehydratase [Candidatus Omnitrophota bacterium]